MEQKKHVFLALDGLRGVAAITVVFLHGWLLLGGAAGASLFERAHLAVDLFFLMSGVVIAHAYDHRFASGMSIGQFMRARIIRLYPLYLIGSILPLAKEASKWAAGMSAHSGYEMVLQAVSAVTMIPLKTGSDPNLFPFNWPAWSLFFEMVINFAYVLAFPLLTTRRLAILVTLTGVGLAYCGVVGGHLNPGNLWSTFLWGFVRVGFSFPLGVLIYRLLRAGSLPRVNIPLPLIFIVAVGMTMPHMPEVLKPIYDVAIVLFVLPLLVCAGIQKEPQRGQKIYSFLGTISYPLYMLHMTLFFAAQFVCFRLYGDDKMLLEPFIFSALVVIAVALAWAMDRLYDRPVRRLATGLFSRKASVDRTSVIGRT